MKSKESLLKNKLTWAVIAELLILAVAGILEPSFFSIEYNQTTGRSEEHTSELQSR